MPLLVVARLVLAALLSFSLVGVVAAHQIWLEREGDGVRLYFGEFGENLREASPGLLDRLSPQAKVAGGGKPLEVERTAGSFAIKGTVAAGDSVVAEDARTYERRSGEKATKVLSRMAARYVTDFKEVPPVNTLDIVPAGKPGAFKVFYQGKPLAKAKLELIAESGWTRELRTDEQGAAEAALPWRGTYVVELEHSDATPGKLGEEAYETARSVSTLSFRLADGLQGPPAPPLVVPKR